MQSKRGQSAGEGQRVVLSLGSNLGDRRVTLRDARRAILDLVQPPAGAVAVASGLYETSPVGVTTPQPAFLNAVIGVTTPLEPLELLGRLLSIERRFGRRPSEVHQPRTLDIDILLIGEQVIDVPSLTVPHPRMHERRFVLVPLAEIAPTLFHPCWRASIEQLLADLATHGGSTAATGPLVCRVAGPNWVDG